jgi:hypothetical protein
MWRSRCCGGGQNQGASPQFNVGQGEKKGKSTISTSTSHGIISKYISLRSNKVKAHQKKISSYNVLLSLTTIDELQLPISKVIIQLNKKTHQ